MEKHNYFNLESINSKFHLHLGGPIIVFDNKDKAIDAAFDPYFEEWYFLDMNENLTNGGDLCNAHDDAESYGVPSIIINSILEILPPK